MALQHVLLGLLVDEPDHGYRLKRRLSPGLPEPALVNDGVLYPLLREMQRRGLIRPERQIHRGRERTVWHPTPEGVRTFEAWLHGDEDEGVVPDYAFFAAHPMVKLLFGEHLQAEEVTAKLERQLQLAGRSRDLLELLAGVRSEVDEFQQRLLQLELASLRARRRELERLLAQRRPPSGALRSA
jgi:DNA-binding PadR family transcriptional regulator